jgi:ankyrin repeat protein
MHDMSDRISAPPSPLPPLPSPERVQELLFEAAKLGRDDMILILLAAGGDIEATDTKGHTPLVLASYHGFETTSELLLSNGANPNGTTASGSPLMGVAFKGHLGIARLLLSAGADPDLRNDAGQTAIMMAALFDRRDIIELLLVAGADLDAVDAAGNSAVALARVQGNETLARWLGEHRVVQAPPP